MPDLGTISRFLAALGGLWDRTEQYLPLILGIALPLAGLVFTFSMLQAFFQDGAEEDYFRIMCRFGITLAVLGDYRSLFMKFNVLSSDLAHHFGDPNSFQNFFQQVQSQFDSLSGAIVFTARLSTSIVTLLILLSTVILVLAYIGLVAAQALAIILLYIFGPLLLALLPSRQLSTVAYTYLKALLQVLLWPAVWSLVLALFTGALLQVLLAGPFVDLVPAILLVLLAILLTQIPRLTGYLTSGALNADWRLGCTCVCDRRCGSHGSPGHRVRRPNPKQRGRRRATASEIRCITTANNGVEVEKPYEQFQIGIER